MKLNIIGIILAMVVIGVFIFDLMMPLGHFEWILHLFPFILCLRFMNLAYVPYLASAYTLLLLLDIVLSPPGGVPLSVALSNRMFGIIVIWLITYFVLYRLKTEKYVEESDRTLKAVNHSSLDAIFIIDGKGEISYLNPAAERLFGYTREETVGRQLHTFLVSEQARQEYYDRLPVFEKSGECKVIGKALELNATKKDGTRFPIELSVTSFKLGNTWHASGIVRDISGRKKAEETLQLTKFSVDHASVSAFLIGKDARILYVNDHACRSLGYSQEELLAMTIPDLDPNVPMSAWADMWGSLKKKGSVRFESLHRKKDGTLITVEISANYVSFGGREYDWAYSVDISERKRAEEALKRAADTGEQLQKVMVAISNSRTFEDALQQLLAAALRLTGMEGGGVYLVEKGSAVLRYHKGLPAAFIRDVEQVPMDRPIVKAVLEQKELIDLVEEFDDMRELFRMHGMRHAFSIPLRVREETFGFLNLGSTRIEKPARVDIQTFEILAAETETLLHRMLIENALRESEGKLSVILNNTPAVVYMVDADGRFIHINRRFEELFNVTSERIAGTSLHDLFPREIAASMLINNRKVIESRAPIEFEEVVPQADGLHIYTSVKSPLFDASGRAYGIAGISTDISERKKMEEEIRHMAHHDALTGLPNRRFYMDIIEIEVAQARRNRTKLAVLFLDLDRFKEVNDTLGHDAGDELLKEVATRIKACIRASDTVARIGGDEFNLILSDIVRANDITVTMRKIMDSFRRPFPVAGQELHITTSIGVSIYPDDSEETDTLFRYADIALYQAKDLGKNAYYFYNPDINRRSVERIRLEGSLRQTLERGELIVYYQPQIDISSGKIICAEALVRWRHPEMGLLDPKRFIPAAEDTGFITAIDEHVLKTACTQVRSWLDAGLSPVCVTVNLSAREFQNPELADKILSILQQTGAPPECLDVEITETLAMSNIERTISRLSELVKMGVHSSIDDFGTGYSSLNYLKRLPIQKLKIDQSFIKDIVIDPDDRAIISAVTVMAHAMRIKVLAEGVETEEQLAFLRNSDCDEAQGFLFSRPLPAEKFKELVSPR